MVLASGSGVGAMGRRRWHPSEDAGETRFLAVLSLSGTCGAILIVILVGGPYYHPYLTDEEAGPRSHMPRWWSHDSNSGLSGSKSVLFMLLETARGGGPGKEIH